jgi:transposase-like protein
LAQFAVECGTLSLEFPVVADLKQVYQAPNNDVAFTNLNIVKEKWYKTYPQLTKSLV